MHAQVLAQKVLRLGFAQSQHRFVQHLGGGGGVETSESGTKASFEEDLIELVAFTLVVVGAALGDVRTEPGVPTKRGELVKSVEFDVVFVEEAHVEASTSSSAAATRSSPETSAGKSCALTA